MELDELLDTMRDWMARPPSTKQHPYPLTKSQLEMLVEVVQHYQDECDPSRWCDGCGARTKERCVCGPIADNN